MSEKTVVVALGHKALGTTLPEQKVATKAAAKAIADLVEDGANVVISHSNGPQVGMIHTAMNEFGKAHPKYTFAPMSVCSAMSQGYIGYDLQNAIRTELLSRGIYKPVATVLTQVVIDPFAPMSVCSAMSQGYIGYDLQNAIRTELLSRGIYKPVATVLTQVVIDPYDDAFAEPEKIIGRVLTAEEAEAEEEKGNYVTEISEGQFRRILASPKPQRIVEIETIRALASAGQIVIAAGGGGIPVLEQGIELHGASAIVEKDLASGLLAEELNADTLLILTSVEKVSLNMGTENEELLGSISAEDAHKYVEADQFTKGSMLPKIEAGLSFIEKKEGRRAIITDIVHAEAGYKEKTGTIIK